MIELLPEPVEALRQLKRACQEAGMDAVIIGATAYRRFHHFGEEPQGTDRIFVNALLRAIHQSWNRAGRHQ